VNTSCHLGRVWSSGGTVFGFACFWGEMSM
jgi:hypothetical protein